MAVPRRLLNQLDMTALHGTGPMAAAPVPTIA
jgi:hypothetical protein